MARILVTGGAGFIGSHLTEALIKQRHTVSIIDDLSCGKKSNIPHKAHFFRLKIQSSSIQRVFKKCKPEIVYHLAAQKSLQFSKQHPLKDAETNIMGSINIVLQSKACHARKFVFYSSAAVYSLSAGLPTGEASCIHPATPYGIGKYATERYIEALGIPYVIIRPSNVYGPRQDDGGEGGVVAIFCSAMSRGKRVEIFNTGKQTRDFIYVKDLVDLSIQCLDAENVTLNGSTGKETSMNSLYAILSKLAKYHTPPKRGKKVVEQFRSALDNTRAKKMLHWKPGTELRKGLLVTYNWFNSQI